MAWAQAAGTVISALGSMKSGDAAASAGREQQQLAEYQAAQLDQNAGQQIAVGQRQSAEALRQSRLLQSRALAVAAASGGGAMDPTVLKIIGGIDDEGKYAADSAMYNAKETARGMKDDARAARYSGAQARAAGNEARRGSRLAAFATVLSGASGFTNAWGGSSESPTKKFSPPGGPNYPLSR